MLKIRVSKLVLCIEGQISLPFHFPVGVVFTPASAEPKETITDGVIKTTYYNGESTSNGLITFNGQAVMCNEEDHELV